MSASPWVDGSLPTPPLPLEESFEGFLGLEWIEVTDASAHVRFELRDDLKQPMGLMHGGIYSAVAETVASIVTVRAVWRDGFTASGLSNSASFLRPITAGIVDVNARRQHHDEREWFWGHHFRDEQGRLCAVVDVIIAVRPVAQRQG